MTTEEFCQALRRARRRKGISQAKLAELSGVNVSMITNYETGRSAPNIRTVLAMLAVLNCKLTIEEVR